MEGATRKKDCVQLVKITTANETSPFFSLKQHKSGASLIIILARWYVYLSFGAMLVGRATVMRRSYSCT